VTCPARGRAGGCGPATAGSAPLAIS
jgi:hypothetical protein